jgi:hypothetical protein
MLNSIIFLFYEEFIQMIIADKSNLVVVFYGYDCCNIRAISSIIVVTDSVE